VTSKTTFHFFTNSIGIGLEVLSKFKETHLAALENILIMRKAQ